MQLRVSTDYAIRAIVYLATINTIVSSIKISEETGMTINYTLKIMRILEKSGLVNSYRGIEGGYRIGLKPKDITLWDVISLMEPTVKFNRCLEEDRYCSRKQVGSCPIHAFYEQLQLEIETLLKGINIQMIADGEMGNVKIINHYGEFRGGINDEKEI